VGALPRGIEKGVEYRPTITYLERVGGGRGAALAFKHLQENVARLIMGGKMGTKGSKWVGPREGQRYKELKQKGTYFGLFQNSGSCVEAR